MARRTQFQGLRTAYKDAKNTQDDSVANLTEAQAVNLAPASPLQTTIPRCPGFMAAAAAPPRGFPDAIFLHAPGTRPLPGRPTPYLLRLVWGGAEKVIEFREHCELG